MKNKNKKNPTRKTKKQKELEKKRKIRHILFFVTAVVMMVGIYFLLPDEATRFKASIMELTTPFDGTTSPIKQVPDWTKLTESERNLAFSSLPSSKIVSLPAYNPSNFNTVLADLGYSSAENKVRNELITYSVAYLGSYTIASGLGEGKGSHPAVDIKIPEGTPVYSIANGVVEKATISNGGFGNHIVITHPRAPSYEDENEVVTLHSSYCHLSKILVKKNQIVKKGDLIGYSGSTGTSTAPHLHFQIDKDSAPFHPYWPFTSAEASARGLNFFSAVNAGLGKSNAMKYTANPMMYVQKYKNFEGSSSSSETDENPSSNSEEKQEVSSIKIESSSSSINTGEKIDIKITLLDKNGDIASDASLNGDVKINTNLGDINKDKLSLSDFNNGKASINFESDESGTATIEAEYSGEEYSVKINVAKKEESEFSRLKVGPDKKTQQINNIVNVKIQGLDKNDNVISDFEPESAIRISAENASLSTKKISRTSFKNGEANFDVLGTKEGDAEITVLYQDEEYKFTITFGGIEVSSEDNIFSDVPANHENAEAIKKLKEMGVIKGDAGKETFRPDDALNRAEVLAMLILALDIDLKDGKSPFPDVPENAWYKRAVITGVSFGIVQGNPDGTFKPEKKVNRAEFFAMLVAAAKIPFERVAKPDPFQGGNPVWYGVFAEIAKNKDLLDFGSNFNPNKNMTRAETAESIWRLISS